MVNPFEVKGGFVHGTKLIMALAEEMENRNDMIISVYDVIKILNSVSYQCY